MALETSLVLEQGRTFFRGLTRRQMVIMAASLIAVAGTLWVFVSLLGRGDYKVLYTGLDPAESNTILKRLADDHIPAQLSPDGKTLNVPSRSLDRARLAMAAEGLPQTGRLGFEIFDKPNWGESDFAENVNYQRALEGELERTIQDLTDVEAVRVNLVLPHESLYTDQERVAKASVLVKPRNGRLSARSLKAITYLVASAVDTLQPQNVTVIDAEGNVPVIMQGGVTPGSAEGASEYEQALDQKLDATLTPILGASHFVAKATVEYDQASTENTQEVYDPKDSVVLTSQITADDDGDGGNDQGIPGAASNVPPGQPANANNANAPNNPPNPNNAATAANPGNGSASAGQGSSSSDSLPIGETSASKTYAVGRTVTHTVRPPGEVRRITAAILVDDQMQTQQVNKKQIQVPVARTPEELKQIQALASAVLGMDAARGDSVTVENIPFKITPLTPLESPHGLQQIGPFLNQYGYIVRYIILGLLGLLIFAFVLRPLVKQLGVPSAEPVQAAIEQHAAGGDLAEAAGESKPALVTAGEAPSVNLPEMSPERQTFTVLKEALVAKISKTPAEAGRLIEGWLREDED
ncbi:MAG: flagellar basal-body MS-ring/collar protein FliF [Terriglobia bacterium]